MQNLLNLPLQFLKSLLAGFWEIFKIGLWLLIQLIEMSAWILSVVSKKIKRTHRLLRISLKRNKMAVVLEPFKQLLGALWTGIVITFWLLIQFIELFVWLLSSLGSVNAQKTPLSQDSEEEPPLPPSVKLRRKAMSQMQPSVSPDRAPTSPRSQRLNSLWQKTPVIIVLCLLLPSIFILTKALLPTTQIFEGNLIVEEISFTYSGNQANKLFLNVIRGIKRVEIVGKQQLILTGNFQSESNPSLKQLKQLDIKLPNPTSKWIIEPINPEASELALVEMRLQPTAKVTRLGYNPLNQQLVVSLQSGEYKQPNSLKLSLGKQPLKVTLEDYQLPGSDRPSNQFTFTPNATEVNLSLEQFTNLVISLPQPMPANSDQWLQGNLAVKDIKFERFIEPNNINDNLAKSSIIKGKIRLAEQELAIEAKQFLLPGKPGIKLLQYLQIHSQQPQGLEIRVQGESKTVKIGGDRQTPIKNIQVSFLNYYLSDDAIIALLAVCVVMTVYLLSWLFIQLFLFVNKGSKGRVH